MFGALGVGIGFGLQNVVNNFVSGLILMFERPIQPGDVVEVSGTSGKVREIGMRATTLTTFEGADVIVPNGTLLSEKLINWTLSDMNRRIDVEVGVAYGSDPRGSWRCCARSPQARRASCPSRRPRSCSRASAPARSTSASARGPTTSATGSPSAAK